MLTIRIDRQRDDPGKGPLGRGQRAGVDKEESGGKEEDG